MAQWLGGSRNFCVLMTPPQSATGGQELATFTSRSTTILKMSSFPAGESGRIDPDVSDDRLETAVFRTRQPKDTM